MALTNILAHGLLLHLQDLFAWILLVLTATGSRFGVWLFVDTLLTYASRRIR